MPIPSSRYCLVVVTALTLSGCYSGGRWTMPNLAFWKTNPFNSTAKSTAPEAIPRPSELAVQPGPPPGTGYNPITANTANATAPAYPTTPASFADQQPYRATQPATGASAPPYVVPQQGYYDPGVPAGMAASPATTNPHAAAPTHGAGTQPARRYDSDSYAAGGPHHSPTPFGAEPRHSAEPYGNPSSSPADYRAANPSGPYANPVRDPHDGRLADYRSTAGAYASPIPDYRSGPHGQAPGQDYRHPPADYQNQPSGSGLHMHGGPSGQGISAAPDGHGGNTPQGYYPPPTGYTPGNTGYHPPGVPDYQVPGSTNPASSGSDGYNSGSGYSPGSVGRYGH